ncbi:MAG: four helix bundle protein [Planctomycetes bacterium]|nr:four helix bundle protein [Planctomycetota bacterium]
MGGRIESFRDLIAWQKGMELCKLVYSVSAAFPWSERFGLASQVRRAAVSVPSNIAEGYARRSKGDYLRFLNIARGSLAEIQTQLILAGELEFAAQERLSSCIDLADEVDRILFGLIRAVSTSNSTEARQ